MGTRELILPCRPSPCSWSYRWTWAADCLNAIERFLPCGEEPDILGWQDEDEAAYKVPLERQAAEEEHGIGAQSALERLIYGKEREALNGYTAFFAGERVRWAMRFCKFHAACGSSENCEGLLPDGKHIEDLLAWLTGECYDCREALPVKWRDDW